MKKLEVWYGALLHDIGKVIYRSKHDYPNGTHSFLGGEYIKSFSKLNDVQGIRHAIKYHHSKELYGANISRDSNAYIVYIADNIASGVDRRDLEEGDNSVQQFDKEIALQSVFNILNGNKQIYNYPFKTNETINYPISEKQVYSAGIYSEIVNEMSAFSDKLDFHESHFNSLLQWTESYWSYIPSSTSKDQLVDISLYDHSKITCAVASCIYDYLIEEQINDYKEELLNHAKDFYQKEVFMIMSLDMSGIQDFIYNISGEKALKSLRARSFYLEFLLEYIVDALLDRLELSRANLLYTGGGHAYLLLPNTGKTKKTLVNYEEEVKAWFLNEFKTDLYLAFGYQSCTGNNLMNKDNRYKDIWIGVGDQLSKKKANRYTADEINSLNNTPNYHDRECKECLRSDREIKDGLCSVCDELVTFSVKLQNMKNDDFLVVGEDGDLSLPFHRKLTIKTKGKIELSNLDNYKIYSKNNPHIGSKIATNLWISNYFKEREIEQYAKQAEGINRLSVLRADVDNLGRTFVSGIPEQFNSLSRTATLSRKLSMFFKYGIDKVLEENNSLATVIYAGGDDLFIIGAWDDIIDLSIEIRDRFIDYTQGTLTISAGIGIYHAKYPLYKMASETGELESNAKQGNKNSIALWTSQKTFDWNALKTNILDQKYKLIKKEFNTQLDHGKALIYKLIELLKSEDRINIARLAYLLARTKVSDEVSTKIFAWANDHREKEYLITAFEYYVYKTRKEK